MIRKTICFFMLLCTSYGLQPHGIHSRTEKISMLMGKKDPRFLIPTVSYKNLTFDTYLLTETNAIQKKLAELYGYSTFSVNYMRQNMMAQARNIVNHPIKGKKSIPYVTHRLWITDLEKPAPPPESAIEKYLMSIKNLGKEWKHYFWCQEIKLWPDLTRTLEQHDVTVKTIGDIEIMHGQQVIQFYLDHNQYCFASDIIRLNIIYQEGGIYSDIGWLLKDFRFICDQFDYFFYHLSPQELDRNLFGCDKKSIILEKMLERLDDFSWIPSNIKDEFEKNPLNQQLFIGHQHLNVIASLLKPQASSLLVLSPKNHHIFEPYRLGSWGEKKRFGNADYAANKDNALRIYDAN